MSQISEVYANYDRAKAALKEAMRALTDSREELRQAIIDEIGDGNHHKGHTPIAFLPHNKMNNFSQGQMVTVSARNATNIPVDQAMQVKKVIERMGWTIIEERPMGQQWSFVIRQNTK